MVDLILSLKNANYSFAVYTNYVVYAVSGFLLLVLVTNMLKRNANVFFSGMALSFFFIISLTFWSVNLSKNNNLMIYLSPLVTTKNKNSSRFIVEIAKVSTKSETADLLITKNENVKLQVECFKETTKECVALIEQNSDKLVNGSNVDDLTASL